MEGIDDIIIPETPEDVLKSKSSLSQLAKRNVAKSDTAHCNLLINKLGKKSNSSSFDLTNGKRKCSILSPDPLNTKKTPKQTSLFNYIVPLNKEQCVTYIAKDADETDSKAKICAVRNLFSCSKQGNKNICAPKSANTSYNEKHCDQSSKRLFQITDGKENGFEIISSCDSLTNDNLKSKEIHSDKKFKRNNSSVNVLCSEDQDCFSGLCQTVAISPKKDVGQEFPLSKPCEQKDKVQGCAQLIVNNELQISSDSEQSLSWLSDINWNAIEESQHSSQETFGKLSLCKKTHSNRKEQQENLVGPVDVLESVKFKVSSVHQNLVLGETVLTLENTTETRIRRCTLREFWHQTVVKKGDYVHVLAPFVDDHAIIDNSSGYFIVNPDYLVSSTEIVSTLFCMRKAVLQMKLRPWDSDGNFSMLIGNLVHQLFQEAVKDNAAEEKQIRSIALKIVKRADNLFAMYSQDASENDVGQELLKYVPSISKWIKDHCFPDNPSPESLNVVNIRDIEDNIWCPKLGVKGKVDLTLEVKIHDRRTKKVTPLELKTGRPSFSAEHQGQVNLYTMMMEDRSNDIGPGLLLYIKDTPQMKRIPADHNLRRGLIQLRNQLASYMWKQSTFSSATEKESKCHSAMDMWTLPEPINDKRLCKKCPYLLPCCFYQKAYKDFTPPDDTHTMAALVPSVTQHLSEMHLQYFQHWSQLLTTESLYDLPSQPFWNEDAYKREKQGLCISHVYLSEDILTQQEREGDVYVHTFIRAPDCPIDPSFSSVGLISGDYVIISNQKNSLEVALATGFLVNVSENYVKLSIESRFGCGVTDKKVSFTSATKSADSRSDDKAQTYKTAEEFSGNLMDLQKLARYEGYLFRIDKMHSNSVHISMCNNLMRLMSCDPVPARLRQLIVDKQCPTYLPTLNKNVIVAGRDILKVLNRPQRKAILKALMTKDYMLLKGMPGTGKTSTIVALVRLLIRLGHSVLLTSHTHSAVDNVLLKLIQYNVNFLRVGQSPKLHPDIRQFSFGTLTKDMTSVKEISELICSKMVVASTCLGANNDIVKKREFDICIVDEASQILQVACLGPLYHAKKFILVGDPKQLPPVVRSEKARLAGMQESLFSRLENSTNSMELVIQYRMNKEIMRLCNELTYEGALECGTEEIAYATLNLTNLTNRKEWLSVALDAALSKSVMLLNTDGIPAWESQDVHGLVKNDIEVDIATQLVECTVEGGVPVRDIGVISPYRCQVELIRKSLKNLQLNEVEVNTVDQYQGRDKDVIVISCVKSSAQPNQDNVDGTVVGDERRLNVAISRAKKKLLIVGSLSTLSVYSSFKKLINCLRADQILYLPSCL